MTYAVSNTILHYAVYYITIQYIHIYIYIIMYHATSSMCSNRVDRLGIRWRCRWTCAKVWWGSGPTARDHEAKLCVWFVGGDVRRTWCLHASCIVIIKHMFGAHIIGQKHDVEATCGPGVAAHRGARAQRAGLHGWKNRWRCTVYVKSVCDLTTFVYG